MTHDITVTSVSGGNKPASVPKATSDSSPPVRAGPASSPIINPTLRLNAALGLVVIEFRNDAGVITTSIPSQRQMEAYQRWAQTRTGPKPSLTG